MNITKKFRVVKKGDNPALGNFVRYYLHQNQVAMKTVSDGLGVRYSTLNNYLKNTSFQFTILWRMSQIVNYNFLMDLGEWLGIPYETKAEKALKEQIASFEKENQALQKENELLRELLKR
ncbi:transcriptional regulator [Flavobacterium branchiophilum]|uniref:Transcriptional regulator n=1 Tax=Flavobacterium branchiophilum TaxID=55197 RepID=A0A2H3KVF4_9FLAO|nr:transcriptional regulator [Flavobacterium branchiophilum]PDS22679.1 transcriptional regulator [Flavobacterium branchiophilum]